MQTSSTPKHIVVIGDGILGASVAYAAATRGARVTVIGTGPGAGASWRSFGWLGSAQAVPEPYHRLRLLSLSRYREFADRRPYDAVVRFSGALAWEQAGQTVQLIQGAEEIEPVAETFARLRSLGHSVSSIDRAAARRLEPAIAPAALPDDGILFARDEGYVDLAGFTGLLLSEVIGAGGELVIDRAARVEVGDDRARAVLSDGTAVTGDELVIATGALTAETLAQVGVTVPQRSTKAALLFTEPASLQLRMLVRTPAGSLRPRPGGGAVVHTSTIERALTPDGDGGFVVDDESVRLALDELNAVFAAGATLRVDRVATGLRPIPGDGWSVVGQVDGIPGCWTAFSHSGATLGPILGELLATELLADGFRSPLLDDYRPARFAAEHAG